jgi:hypothetical protein
VPLGRIGRGYTKWKGKIVKACSYLLKRGGASTMSDPRRLGPSARQ